MSVEKGKNSASLWGATLRNPLSSRCGEKRSPISRLEKQAKNIRDFEEVTLCEKHVIRLIVPQISVKRTQTIQ
ncbi:hypothetical protein CDAR_196461 [Caerostris darwini]|uniref:Uncharacterized protein n=1 Tax=Caerostris darwini TaxID=1538125 RepID=A0AAV4PYR1_9ARAC|nr:hypothetical protein CDAR_196461 [Caerostris darwini]